MANTSSTSPPTMEDYLSSVKHILTEATGEKGLGAKIMSNVQDFMSLDAIKRIQAAKEVIPAIANAMEGHLSTMEVCSCGLEAILRIWNNWSERNWKSEMVACNGLEIVLMCMENHTESANIQKTACDILNHLVGNFRCGTVRGLYESSHATDAIVDAVRHYPDGVGILQVALSFLYELQAGAMLAPPDANTGQEAKYLFYAGGLPLLFLALKHHNTNYGVVIGAFRAIHHLLDWVEGDGEIRDVFDTSLSDHAWCFRTIDEAVSSMARTNPGDFFVGREVFHIRRLLADFTEEEDDEYYDDDESE
jgi:hypothetical protein